MRNKSFTLIELLVVIVIIGILAGVIIVSTSSSISKANIAKVKVFENSIQNELGANMVSRWKLDEIISTTTTPDAWGNNTGTLTNGPVLKSEAECVTGKCMYFDGVLLSSQGQSGTTSSSISTTGNFYIGFRSVYSSGSIDDVRIYNAALSTSQIKQEYIAGLNSLLSNGSISKEEYNERINSLALHDD